MPKPRLNLTAKQQEYLDYIERYIALHGRAPAEHEMQAHFRVTPPSVHRMVVVLEEKGAIRRQPGVARSIEVVPNSRRLAGQSVETVVAEDFYERTPGSFVGRWRIVETEGWTREVLDESVPANITFDARGQGHIQMIYVEGGIDCRFSGNRVEFSWSGVDDRRAKSGRGWAELQADGTLRGRIYFHCGDDSWFVAHRDATPPVTRPARMPVFRPGRRR